MNIYGTMGEPLKKTQAPEAEMTRKSIRAKTPVITVDVAALHEVSNSGCDFLTKIETPFLLDLG